ncbi:MAG: pentapeptide repeat-containing protein [Achromobacter mucicolens]
MGDDLTSADLTRANLSNVDVRFCSFKGAIIKRANMDVVNAKSADWDGAIYDAGTIWPIDFDPGAFGLVSE